MIYYVGFEYNDKIIPVTEDLWAWDLFVLNQRIINKLFPNATPAYLKEVYENMLLSNLKLYPVYYLDQDVLQLPDDILLEYLKELKYATCSYKSILNSDFTPDVICQPLDACLEYGFKKFLTGKVQIKNDYKFRKVNITEEKKILVVTCHLKLYKSSFTLPLAIDKDKTLYEIIMQYYGIFGDFKNVKLGYQLTLGLYNPVKHEYTALGEYKLKEIPINLESKSKLKLLMNPIPVIYANVFEIGADKWNFTITKKLTTQAKHVKWLID